MGIALILFTSGLENLDYGSKDPPRCLRDNPLSAKVGIKGPSVVIVSTRTQATEFI
jgi:hypothetical protein